MPKIVAVGDNVVDCYAALGEMYPGGNCLNVAVFARRFGAHTAYVGAIGTDVAGQAIRTALAKEKVATERLRILAGNTAHCVIGHKDGDRMFLSADTGVSMFVPEDPDLAYAAGFDAVHISRSSGLDDVVSQFADKSLLSYDFSEAINHPRLDEIAARCFLASFSGGGLADEDTASLSRRATSVGAKWALVTRGRRGAFLANADQRFEVAAHPCDVVDTLGAGDTFIAGTLVGLLNSGQRSEEFLQTAAAAAAETCGHFGAIGYGVPLSLEAATH